MRMVKLVMTGAFGLVLASCGGGNKDAGGAFTGIFTSGTTGALAARTISPQMKHVVWKALLANVRRLEQDQARGAVASSRTTWCSALTATATHDHSAAGFSCTLTCPGTPKVLTAACTNTASFSATCGKTTYTAAAGGTFGLSWPDADVTTVSVATLPVMTFTMNMTVSGGSLKAGGSAIVMSMGINFSALANAKDAKGFCAGLVNFTATVDGTAVDCNALADGITACG